VELFAGTKEFAGILKNHPMDIVHAQGTAQTLQAYLARGLAHPRESPSIITTVHYLPDEGYATGITQVNKWQQLSMILNRCSDLVLPVSFDTQRKLFARGVIKDKVMTVHNGLDLVYFDECVKSAEEHSNAAFCPSIVCGGNLIERKGQRYFLMAAARVLKQRNAKFSVVGDGITRPKLHELAANLGINSSVEFTGRISYPEMYRLFFRSTMCISAALGELFPYYVLECMAAKKPIIATDVGGVSEALVNGESGLLIPPKDEKSMANAIETLLKNPDQGERMGANARATVEEKFNLPLMVDNLTKCYLAAVDRRNRKK
jgi:glycosyltransferase involved in cell wall biosynthesis